MIVTTHIETPEKKVFRTATMGDIVPAGSVWVVKSEKKEIRIPYGSEMHVREMHKAVNKLLAS
jgi:hypothetical protein